MLCCVALFLGTGRELVVTFKTLRAGQPWMHEFMWYVSRVTPFLSYGLYSWFLWRGIQKSDFSLVRLAAAYIVLQVCISLLLVYVLKVAVGKPRPMVLLTGQGYTPFTLSPDNHSFPSGHSSEIMGTVVPLAARRRQYLFSLGLGLAAALVTFSRLYLSMHHLSDIAAGLAVGSACGILIQYVSTRGSYDRQARQFPGKGLYRAFRIKRDDDSIQEPRYDASGAGLSLFRQFRRGAGFGLFRRFL